MKHLVIFAAGFCALTAGVLLGGCATAGADILPRVGSALEAAKSAYVALCSPPPDNKEKLCEDLRGELNKIIDAYTQLNDAVGGEENP